MGQGASSHEPLDRGRRSFRRSKRQAGLPPRSMDRLRRSLRDSLRRKKDHVPESSKPHQWQSDEAGVRAGTCCFHVKYLGCVEVFESRGMQVCEEALKLLRNSRRRPVRAVLFVSGDGLRVVEDDTKGLIVDQTIEKVSFCAPDRNHEKGFSYICRDGTTRRWMCHGFLALKESGERLSHAVGCAFAACLERKQKRDKECGVTMTFDPKNSTFTRSGSFRQASLTERLQDPQELKPTEPIPVKPPAFNPYAIERPHATASMLQRQGSFRGFQQLAQSPFKRQMSLRYADLPSTLERQRSLSLEGCDVRRPVTAAVSPIPEVSPLGDRATDSVSAMCQQLSQGLSLLSSSEDFLPPSSQSPCQKIDKLSTITNSSTNTGGIVTSNNLVTSNGLLNSNGLLSTSSFMNTSVLSTHSNLSNIEVTSSANSTTNTNVLMNSSAAVPALNLGLMNGGTSSITSSPATVPVPVTGLPQPDQWLGAVVNAVAPPPPAPRRAPPLHLRAHSLGSADTFHQRRTDPFDADWAAVGSPQHNSTNPFAIQL